MVIEQVELIVGQKYRVKKPVGILAAGERVVFLEKLDNFRDGVDNYYFSALDRKPVKTIFVSLRYSEQPAWAEVLEPIW